MSDGLVEFLTIVSKLKTLPRAGWKRCGVTDCESVADHSFGVALLALLIDEPGIDRAVCLQMAIVHDLAESIVGDITPHDSVSPEEKRNRETQAISQLGKVLSDDSVVALWHRFEAADDPEAQLVRDLDVIEMAWQARVYERVGSLSEESAKQFQDSAKSRLRTDPGRRLFDRLMK